MTKKSNKNLGDIEMLQKYLNLTAAQIDDTLGFWFFKLNIGRLGTPLVNATTGNAGKMNGDNVDDIIGGTAPYTYPNYPVSLANGTGVVYFGNDMGYSNSYQQKFESNEWVGQCNGYNCFTVVGDKIGDGLGVSFAGNFDINGDQHSDVVFSNRIGDLYFVTGRDCGFLPQYNKSSLLQSKHGFVIHNDFGSQGFGSSVSSAGNFTGGQYDSIIVAGETQLIPGVNVTNFLGSAYIINGQPSFHSISNMSMLVGQGAAVKIVGLPTNELPMHLSLSVTGVGDINVDGKTDVAFIGGSLEGLSYSPSIYVLYGNSKLTHGIPILLPTIPALKLGFVIEGLVQNNGVSYTLTGGYDINHDGYPDLVIGNPCNDDICTGQVVGLYGNPKGFNSVININDIAKDSTMGFMINGAVPGQGFGQSVSMMPDFNGDGINDLVIAGFTVANALFPGIEEKYHAGYIFYGNTKLNIPTNITNLAAQDGVIIILSESCGAPGGSCYNTLNYVGDVNNDGLSDICLGASFWTGQMGTCLYGQNSTSEILDEII